MPDFPDVSSYQGRPDWAAVKAGGFVGAICKAYEYQVDPSFGYNWSSLAAQGLARSAYCFGRPSFAPAAQANTFADVVLGAGYQAADWPLVLDAEVPGLSPDWCIEFLQTLDGRTGKRSLLYTYSAFLASDLGSDSRLAGWPLWIANYSSSVTTPWPYWAWQYTDNGYVPGIGNCDVSHLVGSIPTPVRKKMAVLVRNTTDGWEGVIGVGAAHHLATQDEVNRVSYEMGGPPSNLNPLQIVQVMQDWGAWDTATNQPRLV